MPYVDDWKSAKKIFEQATGAKKPSESFLLSFRKSTGVEAALKKMDEAKTAEQMNTAIKTFREAARAYGSILDKAISDPKTTKVVDKTFYAKAATTLKEKLGQIAELAETTAQSLQGKGAKEKVNTGDLRKQAIEANALKEGREHLALRKKMIVELGKTLADYTNRGKEITGAGDNAAKHLAQAKSFKQAGDTLQADVAAGVCERFAEQAADLLAAINREWDEFRKDGSELMQARGDRKDIKGKMSAEDLKTFVPEHNKAFSDGDAVQVKIATLLGSLSVKVNSAKASAEEAANYRMVGQDPQVFVKRLAEIRDAVAKLDLIFGDRHTKAVENRRKKTTEYNGYKAAKDPAREKNLTQMRQAAVDTLSKHNQGSGQLSQLRNRLATIPATAREDRAVSTVYGQVDAAITAAELKAQNAETELNGFVSDMDKYLLLVR